MAPMIPARAFFLLIACSLQAAWAADAPGPASYESSESGRKTVFPRLNASGSLRTDYLSSSKTVDDRSDFIGLTAQLKLLPVFGDKIDGKIEARFINPDITHDDRTPRTSSLLEGYLTARLTGAELRIGKQNVAWGRADAVNPTDNLTPHNYTVLLPFEEDQRFGTTAIKLDYFATPEYTVTFFTTPLFEPSKIPLPLPAGAVVQKNNIPAQTLSNSETGLKLNKTSGEIDWSVSYYHGFSLLPEIRFKGVTPPSSLLLELRYPEMDVFGADIARNYGRYGFRAEAAYLSPRNYSSQESTTLQPSLFSVAGVDRTFFENFNINMQLVGRWVRNFKDPEAIQDPIQRTLAIQNAILFGQRRRSNYGFTARISDKWFNDTLEAESLLVVYYNPMNLYVRPLMTYAFTDHIKGSVGGELFSGPQDSYFGLLKPNQGIFTEVRYTF